MGGTDGCPGSSAHPPSLYGGSVVGSRGAVRRRVVDLTTRTRFASRYKTGNSHSQQVRVAKAAASLSLPVQGLPALQLVSAVGLAGLSGPRVMSGLAEVGPALGGGCMARLGVLAAGPGIAAAAAVAMRFRLCRTGFTPRKGGCPSRWRPRDRLRRRGAARESLVRMLGAHHGSGKLHGLIRQYGPRELGELCRHELQRVGPVDVLRTASRPRAAGEW